MKRGLLKAWHEYRGFAVFIVLMLIFRSALADWNVVPTGSMKPTILEGDRILVNKLAYDFKVPLTHIALYKFADPGRGDIVVFESKAADTRLVKQVDGDLFDDAGADAVKDVLAGLPLDDDVIDAVFVQKLSEQQARRAGTDDRDLGLHAF